MLKVKLVVVGGATEGDEFQLKLPAVLGRARSASIPLPHPLVSRQHCELIERDQQLVVRDLGSTNGTFVGSSRVEEDTVIDHGALLTIGTVTFRAFYEGMPVTPDGFVVPVESPVHSTVGGGEIDTTTLTRVDTGQVGRAASQSASQSAPKVGQKAK